MQLYNAIQLILLLHVGMAGFCYADAGFVYSENFVVLAPSDSAVDNIQEFAKGVLKRAEKYRKDISIEWLGYELPGSIGQTVICVNPTEDADTGVTWAKDKPGRSFHNIYLRTSETRAVSGILAHEVAHVVFATQFPGDKKLPLWIEEGIASRYDDADRQKTRQQMLRWFSSTGNWPDIDEVLDAEKISSRDQRYYAAAASICDFLIAKEGKESLMQFAGSVPKRGLANGLNEFYSMRGKSELEETWRQWVITNLQTKPAVKNSKESRPTELN